VRNFRGCTVRAELRRGEKPSVKLDGREVPALIPAELLPPGSEVRLEVTYT